MSKSLSQIDSETVTNTALRVIDAAIAKKSAGAEVDRRPAMIRFYPVPWESRLPMELAHYDYNIDLEKAELDAVREYNKKKFGAEKERAEIKRVLTEAASTFSNRKSTCLISSIKQAREYFSQLDPEQNQFELVYISDMIEDCPIRDSLSSCRQDGADRSSERLVLQKRDIDREIATVSSLSCEKSPRAASINVTIIRPRIAMSEDTHIPIPAEYELEKFWRVVFEKHGFPVSDGKFSYGFDYPKRLIP